MTTVVQPRFITKPGQTNPLVVQKRSNGKIVFDSSYYMASKLVDSTNYSETITLPDDMSLTVHIKLNRNALDTEETTEEFTVSFTYCDPIFEGNGGAKYFYITINQVDNGLYGQTDWQGISMSNDFNWYTFDTSGCALTDWEVVDSVAPLPDKTSPAGSITLNTEDRRFILAGDAIIDPTNDP